MVFNLNELPLHHRYCNCCQIFVVQLALCNIIVICLQVSRSPIVCLTVYDNSYCCYTYLMVYCLRFSPITPLAVFMGSTQSGFNSHNVIVLTCSLTAWIVCLLYCGTLFCC